MVDFPGRKEVVAGVRTVLGPSGRELGELVADRVRFWRWQQLTKIMKRAARLKEKHSRQHVEVPLKFFLPFAEEASKEDDDKLIYIWANLLASASDRTTAFDLLCIDILKKISFPETKLLMRMYQSERSTPRAAGDVSSELQEIVSETVTDGSQDGNNKMMQKIEERLLQGDIIPVILSKMHGNSGSSVECRFYRNNIRTILALQHLDMIRMEDVETPGHQHFRMRYLILSDLAYQIVHRCSGAET